MAPKFDYTAAELFINPGKKFVPIEATMTSQTFMMTVNSENVWVVSLTTDQHGAIGAVVTFLPIDSVDGITTTNVIARGEDRGKLNNKVRDTMLKQFDTYYTPGR